MTTRAALLRAIEAVEKAPEGTRAISDVILIACGWSYDRFREGYAWKSPDEKWEGYVDRPCPSTSLDAALTLVPVGHSWIIEGGDDPRPSYCASVAPEQEGHARTPAIALCLAALRARLAMME